MKRIVITLSIIAALVGLIYLQAYLEVTTGTQDRPVSEPERNFRGFNR